MSRSFCVTSRIGMTVVLVVAVLGAIGLFPHPSARHAEAMMYIAAAIAIVALGSVWRLSRRA